MRTVGPQTEDASYSDVAFPLVDGPKTSFRIASLLVWSASAFLVYKAVVRWQTGWILWLVIAFFGICCYGVVNEFMLRPTRVTTIRPLQRQLVVQETARWRKKELVASIPRSARFEVVRCDSDMNLYEVRIKSTDKGWVTVAEYVSKENAERMARDANCRLL